MALTTIDDRGLKTPIDLLDNEKIRFGTGNDLELFHNGTHSFINNSTGNLNLQTSGNLWIENQAGSEVYIKAIANGAVELYYDGVKKFETTSYGALFTDNVKFDNPDTAGRDVTWEADNDSLHWEDNTKATFGAGSDLQIYHTGDDSWINETGTGGLYIKSSDLRLKDAADNGDFLKCNTGGAVELYYDNSIKLYTTSTGAQVAGDFRFSDGEAAKWGNSQDLQIYHDGSNSFIYQNGTGELRLHADTTRFKDRNGGEDLAVFTANGAVELYHDNNKVLETITAGIKVSRESASSSYIEMVNSGGVAGYLYGQGNNEIHLMDREGHQFFKGIKDAGAELYYDNSKKFETTTYGNFFTGSLRTDDGGNIKLGTGSDLQIYHDGSHSRIHNGTGQLQLTTDVFRVNNAANDEIQIKADANGAVELNYDNVRQFYTTATGSRAVGRMELDGGIRLTDTRQIQFGDPDGGDFKIYYDGSNTYLKNAAGSGAIKTCGDSFYAKNAADNEYILRADAGGAGFLYYSGNEKLKTTSSGITVTGSVTTQDINLSNLNAPTPNEVDSTRGSWTMQEGADDLFLINRSNGKKYKFNLTEVS